MNKEKLPTLVELLQWRAKNQPAQKAYSFLVDGIKEQDYLTYGELDKQARAIASFLQSKFPLGSRVILIYPQGLEFISGFFGCLYAGMIAIPAPVREASRLKRLLPRIAFIADKAQATILLTNNQLLTEINDLNWENISKFSTAEILEKQLSEKWLKPEINPQTLAYLQYTSGSTSQPKGVMLTHKNLMCHLADLQESCGYDTNSITVTWMPYFHNYGLVEGILEPFFNGHPCYLMSTLSFIIHPLHWLQAISHYQATHSQAPNFAYAYCVEKIAPQKVTNLNLNSWQYAGIGAKMIQVETLENFFNLCQISGFKKNSFSPAYGLAEATLGVTNKSENKPPIYLTVDSQALSQNQIIEIENGQKLVGVGKPIKNTKIVIINPETLTELSPNLVGEIWVSSPGVAEGYWDNREATKQTFQAYLDTGEGPFLRTGDLGFIKDEELFITGRLKDLIIIRGQKNDFTTAFNSLQKALEIEPNNIHTNRNLASMYWQKQDIESAIFYCEKVLEIDNTEASANNILSTIYLQRNQLDKVSILMNNALNKHPNNPHLNWTFANFYRQKENLEEALKYYQKALDFGFPNRFPVFNSMAEVFKQKGDIQAAINNYQKALELQPDNEQIKTLIKNLEGEYLSKIKQLKTSKVISILGMHRSGTSCLAGSLQKTGIFTGKVLEFSSDNLKGQIENLDIQRLNEFILKHNNGSWDNPPSEINYTEQHQKQRDNIILEFNNISNVWMFKDPRTVLNLKFWQEGLDNLQLIGTFRHPLKVAMSLYQRDKKPLSEGLNLWIKYNKIILEEYQKSPFPIICFDVSQDKYFTQLKQVINTLNQQFEGLNLDEKLATEFYDSKLVHQEAIAISPQELSQLSDQNYQDLLTQAEELYQQLTNIAVISKEELSLPETKYYIPLEETIKSCQEILEIQPNNPHIYWIMGNIYSKENNLDEAIKSYQKAIEIAPENFNINLSLADTYRNQKNYAEALKIYQQMISFNAENAEIYCLMAEVYQQKGDIETAINTYNQGLKIQPKYYNIYHKLGDLYQKENRFEEAIDYYKKLLEIDPNSLSVNNILADIYIGKNELNLAATYSEKAINLAPTNPYVTFTFAKLNSKQGNLDEAIKYYQKALDFGHPNKIAVFNNMAEVFKQKGDIQAAINNYEKALEIEPNNFWCYRNLGEFYLEQNEFKKANQAFIKARDLAPENPWVYISIAGLRRKQGNFDAAINNYRKGIKLGGINFWVHKGLADLLNQKGEIKPAINNYQKALKLQPDNEQIKTILDNLKNKNN